MSSVRVALVSDSHLSPRTPEANENWVKLIETVDATEPDVVVHTGDISLDGAAGSADLHHAHSAFEAVESPLLFLPGNHDLGDNPCEGNEASDSLASAERLRRYREIMGDDRWAKDVGGWRLVGCNAQLFGSGLEDEEDQWEWLAAQLAPESLDGQHLAFFLHKPLLHSDPHPAEHDVPIRYVRPESRSRLTAMLKGAEAKVVVSGHVHQFRQLQAVGMRHVWVPTSWATLPPQMQALVGERWVGGLTLELAADGNAAVQPVRPDGVGQFIIGDTIPNPYDH